MRHATYPLVFEICIDPLKFATWSICSTIYWSLPVANALLWHGYFGRVIAVRPIIQRVRSEESSRLQINKLFDDTRKRLVETGTRNRLVHFKRANTKGNVLNVADAHSDSVYGILADRRTMRFVPMARGKDASGDAIVLARPDGASEHGADAGLLTRLGPDTLQKKAAKDGA